MGELFPIQLGIGLSKDMVRNSLTSLSIDHYSGKIENVPVDVYTIEDRFDEPVQGYNTMSMGGLGQHSSSGALVMAECPLIFEDGTVHVDEQTSYIALEHISTLPDNIMAYLTKE